VLTDCEFQNSRQTDQADRSVLDQHPYLAFGLTQNNDPWSAQAGKACSWGGGTNDTQKSFGVTIGGEWSLATNNCGKWLNGVDSVPSYETQGQGSCKQHEEWFNWDQEYKDGLNSYCQANMDALQNWFFWTWKIGNSTELGYAPSPFWHYQLGLKEGWIPADPRSAGGYCGRAMNIGGAQVRLTQIPDRLITNVSSMELFPLQLLVPFPALRSPPIKLHPTQFGLQHQWVLPTRLPRSHSSRH
jgi:glucan 1,3-beta-glucosidase